MPLSGSKESLFDIDFDIDIQIIIEVKYQKSRTVITPLTL